LIEFMTGRRITGPSSLPRSGTPDDAVVRLSLRQVGRRRALAPVSIDVRRGEAVGLAGLLGSGRSELARLVAGVDRPDSGAIHVDGRPVPCGSIRASIAAGIAYAPEDRRDALALELSVRENIVLAMQAARKGGGVLGTLRRSEQDRIASHYIAALSIRTPSAEAPVRNLSGGNQQKVLLARWLAMQPCVMILDEPTRGVDIGARSDIESLIASMRSQGMAIVFVSAEIDELVRVCSRALVLRDRAALRMLNDVSDGTILAAIAGESEGEDG
jgi:simple sugar transport system ATP-binding protein